MTSQPSPFPEPGPSFPESGPSFPESAPSFPESGPSFPEPGPSFPESGPSFPEPVEGPTMLRQDLRRARTALIEAELALHPRDRFLAAHLAALRVAAVVLATRARRSRRGHRPRNAWQVLSEVAPELGEWAAFFAATEGKRDAVRSGVPIVVTAREADDLVRDAQTFFGLVERRLDRRSAPRDVDHD